MALKERSVHVEYLRMQQLNRDGKVSHESVYLHVIFDSEVELLPLDNTVLLPNLESDNVSVELRALTNNLILEKLTADGGFYLYDEWIELPTKEKWQALCMHCNHYAMVSHYRGKPTCDLCILVIKNQKHGRLGR